MCVLLAKNPEVQDRLYAEIQEAIEENNGSPELDYNTIQSLPYMEQTIHETLRNWPLTILERNCTRDYKIPGTNAIVPKGMLVQIATSAMMKDPKFYPNPEVFDPDNFGPEAKAERNPYSYLGFGQGPRNCIGMRFALLQVKIAMVRTIANYRIVPGPKTPVEMKPEPMSQGILPQGGAWVKVEARK